MNKILILYTSIGLGHKMIARNIAMELESRGYVCVTKDILEVEKGALSSFGEKLYMKIITRVPWVWEFLYKSKLVHLLLLPFRNVVAGTHSSRVLKLIQDEKPELVITTQVTASSVVSYLKKKGLIGCSFFVAFSDYHFHRFWKVDNVDGYLANIEEQKESLVKEGVDPEIIHVCGVTVPTRENGGEEGGKTVLIAAGSLGIFEPRELIDELIKRGGVSVVVVTGKNEKLRMNLSTSYEKQDRVRVLGFTENMDELYKNAGVFITKPGGISVAEALSFRLPVYVVFALPGQEEFNMKYLVPRGLVFDLRGKTVGEIADFVIRELETGADRKILVNNSNIASILGKTEVLARSVSTIINASRKV